jgi:hypothetical protein
LRCEEYFQNSPNENRNYSPLPYVTKIDPVYIFSGILSYKEIKKNIAKRENSKWRLNPMTILQKKNIFVVFLISKGEFL